MKSAIPLIVPIILGMYEVNESSESEINCYEKGSRDEEEHPFKSNKAVEFSIVHPQKVFLDRIFTGFLYI
jgi:hypothetical protein